MDDPKTRREKKGLNKTKSNTVYSARHVREQERMIEKSKNKSNDTHNDKNQNQNQNQNKNKNKK
jgi:hypothetical protein